MAIVGVIVKAGMVDGDSLGVSVMVTTGMTSVGSRLQLARMIMVKKSNFILFILHLLKNLFAKINSYCYPDSTSP